MSRPFLIIQLRPEDVTAENELQAICQYGQLAEQDYVRIRAEQCGLPEINLTDYSGIIVGGSPFDVTTPEAEKSAIQIQLEQQFNALFDQIMAQDFPFLGCCSGNGLLGNYLNTPMSREFGESVGCKPVTMTEAGRSDPLLETLPETIHVLLGHKEACDEVPQGATLLLAGTDCPIQMFRVKNNIYATQFHPEGDEDGFALRIRVYQHHGYFRPEEAEQLITQLAGFDISHAQSILRRFVMRYQA